MLVAVFFFFPAPFYFRFFFFLLLGFEACCEACCLLLLFFFSGWTATPWMVRYCGISCFACHVGCLAIHVRPNYAIITGPLLPKFRFAHVCIILISLSDCSFNWFKTFFPRTLLSQRLCLAVKPRVSFLAFFAIENS